MVTLTKPGSPASISRALGDRVFRTRALGIRVIAAGEPPPRSVLNVIFVKGTTTMNTTLSAPTSLHEHPPQQLEQTHLPVRRVGLFDRLALRLGLALLVWARRPVRVKPQVATERYITEAEIAELREARYSSHHLLTLVR